MHLSHGSAKKGNHSSEIREIFWCSDASSLYLWCRKSGNNSRNTRKRSLHQRNTHMKKAFLSLACLACASMLSAQSTTQWKISIQNNGTSGGYIVDNQLKSTELAGYSTHYPQSGFMPAWFIRFPKGNYTVTSQNVGTIDVQQANTSKDILTDASAKSFSVLPPTDGTDLCSAVAVLDSRFTISTFLPQM